MLGKGIHRLGSDTVEADRELENISVVLCTGVDHRNAFHYLTQRDTTPVVPHPASAVFLNCDVNPFAIPHDVFVYGIINNLFDQDIDTVIRVRAITQAADIHTGPLANMLKRTKGFYLGFVVLVG